MKDINKNQYMIPHKVLNKENHGDKDMKSISLWAYAQWSFMKYEQGRCSNLEKDGALH